MYGVYIQVVQTEFYEFRLKNEILIEILTKKIIIVILREPSLMLD
jgi:hypothetical protein